MKGSKQKMKHLNELNPEQKKAVLYGEGPLLILAGAGSGKTKTLTCRIAHLIKKAGVSPDEILAVTFTNKAAKEMAGRVESLIGASTRGMWISTFHSACARILRENIQLLGYPKNFNIIDQSDSVALVKTVMRDLGISERLFSPRAVQGRISALKGSIVTPEDFAATAQNFGFESKVAKVYPVYQDRLKASGVLDFDDLLMLTVLLLKKHKKALASYQERFRHILVDEYQDTNPAQYLIVKLLAGKRKNLCVVGDDDQSIYGFRGADLRNILEFEKDFPDAKVIKLEQNYRSTQHILDGAWSVVCKNAGRRPKKLWTALGHGEKLEYVRVADEEAEAAHVAREISRSVKEGLDYKDFAVLYRTNTQSRTIEEAMRKEGVPYVVVGGMKFYDRKEIKDLINYLKVVSNAKDSVSLKKIVNTPPRGIGEATMKKASEVSIPENLPLVDALTKLLDDEGLAAGPKKRISEFLEMLEDFSQSKKKLAPSKLAEKILTDTGYLPYLRESLGAEAAGKAENLKELIASIEEFERESDAPSLEGYLAQISLITDWENKDAPKSAVSLMTLHLSKGLEFPVVFITGLEEGIVPHVQSSSSEAETEEERRLLYVGMTRARQKLSLLNASTRRLAGLTQSNRPSRFIEEIPASLLATKRVGLPKKTVASAGGVVPFTVLGPKREREAACPFKCGAQVAHPMWGLGVVEKTEGRGEDLKVTVLFKSVGKKKLLAKVASLTRA